MPTQLVNAPFSLAAGTTVSVENDDGLSVTWTSDRRVFDISLAGRVEVRANVSGDVAGVHFGNWVNDPSKLVIQPGGAISVTVTGSTWGHGVYIGSWGPDIYNHGLIQVTSDGSASGITTYSSGTFGSDAEVVNAGSIVVSGLHAYAVRMMNGGSFLNSGLIEQSSRTNSEAVYMFGFDGQLRNTGTIRVQDNDPSRHSTAVMLETGTAVNAGVTFVNSGEIQGDYALRAAPMQDSPPVEKTPIQMFTNTGVMRGMVDLGASWARFENSGLVVGNIDLGRGDDTYDGSGGRVDGLTRGGAGADSILGGANGDTLWGDSGVDTLAGGGGDDHLEGGPQDNLLDGGAGYDTLVLIGSGVVDLEAGTARSIWANDTLRSIERVQGGEQADSVWGTSGSDTLSGDKGADVLWGRSGDDSLPGGDGDDFLRGEDGADVLRGGAGFDDMHGNKGDDTLNGDDGHDWVVGGQGSDLLFGDAGNDLIYGNMATDSLYGASGADTLRGGQDADTLSGGADNDLLFGDRGDDVLRGDDGGDIFFITPELGVDRVLDFSSAEGDRVAFETPGYSYSVSFEGGDAVVSLTGGHKLILVGVTQATLGTWLLT